MRPILLILILMLSGIYIDAFSSEAADKRENFPSVAEDLVDLAGDVINRREMQVMRLPGSLPDILLHLYPSGKAMLSRSAAHFSSFSRQSARWRRVLRKRRWTCRQRGWSP